MLSETALSRRLQQFHLPGDVVYAQTIESFLPKFLNLHGARQHEKVSGIPQQSIINEIIIRCKCFFLFIGREPTT